MGHSGFHQCGSVSKFGKKCLPNGVAHTWNPPRFQMTIRCSSSANFYYGSPFCDQQIDAQKTTTGLELAMKAERENGFARPESVELRNRDPALANVDHTEQHTVSNSYLQTICMQPRRNTPILVTCPIYCT